jgi:hypothetical protein
MTGGSFGRNDTTKRGRFATQPDLPEPTNNVEFQA